MLQETVSLNSILKLLMEVLNARDPYTLEHSSRVAAVSSLLANKLDIHETWQLNVETAAYLHDIGKIAIPDSILNKTERLNPEEYALIKEHSLTGYRLISEINHFSEISQYVLAHHEWWNGEGYPSGLKKEAIPLGARIIALCDAFDTMISRRTYKDKLSPDYAFEEIQKNRGKQFDPELVDLFLKSEAEIVSSIVK